MAEENSVSERMRTDWNQRAREDPHYYVAFGGRDQQEAEFEATAADVLRSIEAQLKRLPAKANRRAWRALEIGCGPGRLMKPLARHFGEIHGVDVSDEMVRLAQERLAGFAQAHVHATDGASLEQFADDSFEFVYSYAVFQHIPSHEVVLSYMREIRRVLKPGGIFHGQFNGLAHSSDTNTWSGVVFSADDIRSFTRENGLQLLSLDGEHTQYMWTTWRKPALTARQVPDRELTPEIRRITNAYTGDALIPQRGRHAAASFLIQNLPADCDLNHLEVLVDGTPGEPVYVGPRNYEGAQQVNAWLPEGVRTGLVPVELRMDGRPLCRPAVARVIPAGPLVPRIVLITDGINLAHQNATSTGLLKIQLEEVASPDLVGVTVDDREVPRMDILRTDPRPPRYELNVELPQGLATGPHILQVAIGHRRLPPAKIIRR
jgi:SAM-dependent methyltransferase